MKIETEFGAEKGIKKDSLKRKCPYCGEGVVLKLFESESENIRWQRPFCKECEYYGFQEGVEG